MASAGCNSIVAKRVDVQMAGFVAAEVKKLVTADCKITIIGNQVLVHAFLPAVDRNRYGELIKISELVSVYSGRETMEATDTSALIRYVLLQTGGGRFPLVLKKELQQFRHAQKRLDLSNVPLRDPRVIIDIQEHFPMLQELSLDNCSIGEQAYAFLSQFTYYGCLRALNLSNNPLVDIPPADENAPPMLFDTISQLPRLTHLALSNIGRTVDDRGVVGETFLTRFPFKSLQQLHVGNNEWLCEDVEDIVPFRRMPALKKLVVAECEDLSEAFLLGMERLCPTVQVEVGGFERVAEVICRRISKICFHGTNNAVVREVSRYIDPNDRIRYELQGGADFLSYGLRCDLRAMAGAITELNLSGIPIREPHLLVMSLELARLRLQTLNLSRCKLEEKGAACLQALGRFVVLRSLDLSYNQIESHVINNLQRVNLLAPISHLATLEELSLEGCFMPEGTGLSVEDLQAFSNHPTLRVLKLGANDRLANFLLLFAPMLPALEVLDVTNCPDWTPFHTTTLRAILPRLQIIDSFEVTSVEQVDVEEVTEGVASIAIATSAAS